jgi:hypothetical protein
MNVVFRGIAAAVVGHVVGSIGGGLVGGTSAIITDSVTGSEDKARKCGAVTGAAAYIYFGVKSAAAVWRSTGE